MPKVFNSIFFSLFSLIVAIGLTLTGCSSPVNSDKPVVPTEGDLTVAVDSSGADLETLSKIEVRVFVKDTERTPAGFSDGNFDFKGLPVGKWTILVEGKGLDQVTYYRASAPVTIPATGPANLKLEAFGVLPIKVVNPAASYGLNDSLFLKTGTDSAVIHYTTDNTPPTKESPTYIPSQGISLGGSVKVRAKAFKDLMADSPEGVITVLVDQSKAPMPKFSPAGGKFTSTTLVTLSSASGTIIYTDNGDDPKTSLSKKTYSSPFNVTFSSLIRAYVTGAPGLSDSVEARAEFIIGGLPVPVSAPSFNLAPGTYKTNQSLGLSCEAGAKILYSLDNSGNFENYSGLIPLNAIGNAKTVYTVKAYATMVGKENSILVMGEFVIDPAAMETSKAPTITTSSGTQSLKVGGTVTVTGAAGSQVYVTLDGTKPTTALVAHASPYSFQLNSPGSFNVQAIALESGKYPSDPTSVMISVTNINVTADPKFSKAAGTYATDIEVVLTADEGTIYYKKSAADSFVPYASPIQVKGNGTVMTISAYALADGKEPSSPISSTYTITYNQDPVVNATPDTGTFDVSIPVTLTAMNPSSGTYRINDGTSINYNNNDSIVIGADAAPGASVKLTLTNGTASKDFFYTKNGDNTAYSLFFKHTSAPEAYVWVKKDAQGNYLDPAGATGTVTEVFGTWATTEKMTAAPGLTGWYKADLKAKGIPAGTKVGIIFKIGSTKLSGDANQYRTITGWCQILSSLPSWTDDNPEGPIADANPGSQTFSTTLNVSLIAKNPTNGQYKLGTGAFENFADGKVITITAPNVGDVVTLTVTNSGVTKTFNYTKSDAPSNVKLFVKKTGATGPLFWCWETAGLKRALMTLENYTWNTRPKMTADSTDWWTWEIPAKYNPVNSLGVNIDGADIAPLPVPVGSTALSGNWFFDGTWSNVDPRQVTPPTVSMTPDGGMVEVTPFDITINASSDPRDPTTAVEYRINNGPWTPVTNNKIPSVGTGLANGQTVTIEVKATNTKGTTTISKTFTKGAIELPAFSWNNASVYFMITDRFSNGNPANDTSYGRKKTDANGKDIGTFHGGDLAGITNKLNANYFKDLGINTLWITAPYEQIHGWVGGGSGTNGFAHYAYHGYYAADYTNFDANMGTAAEFRTMITTAHSQGIRVIVDIVMNHAGYNSLTDMVEFNFGGWKAAAPSLNDTFNWTPLTSGNWYGYHDQYIAYRGGEADWGRWWGGNWVRTGDSSKGDMGIIGYPQADGSDLKKALMGLPDFLTESTSAVALPTFLKNKASYGGAFSLWAKDTGKTQRVRDWLVEWLAQWVREYGVDGFRIDTAKHVEMEHWAALRTKSNQALTDWRAAEMAKPLASRDPAAAWTDKFWMVGEFWNMGAGVNGVHVAQGGAFDANINFNLRGSVGGALSSAASINSTYSGYDDTNGSDTDNWNFLSYLSSHDTGQQDNKALFYDNFAGSNPANQRKAGSLLLLAPGAVQIYYGDEAGRKTGENGGDVDQGTRSQMVFGADADTSILTHWQKVGQFRNRHISVGGGLHSTITSTNGYAFSRTWKTADKCAVVLDASGSVDVTVSGLWSDGTLLTNGYDGTTATVTGGKVTFSAGSNGTILIEKK